MGGVCSCTNVIVDSKDDDEETKDEPTKKFGWNKESKIKLKTGSSFGKPLVSTNSELLFVSSSDNCIITVSYDIKNKTYSEPQEIKCTDKSFDVQECEYTFDDKNNVIYFINNNKEIMTLSLNTKKITQKQNITTDNNKYVQIEKVGNKIYVLGANATATDDESKLSDENFICVPTSDALKGFGFNAFPITARVNETDYIYIVGGVREEKEEVVPCDTIWVLNVSLLNQSTESKWIRRYLFGSATSFGIINYKNKYLITFGGFQFFSEKKEYGLSNEIHILDLETYQWYLIKKRLRLKCRYFALYVDDGSNIVHLFAWNGKYFTIKINDILNELQNDEYFERNNWTEQGKTALPTKSKSVKNLGPKIEADKKKK